ncbi:MULTISPECIES: DUF423 domain-containing protein [Paenibacillus]|jgi:uncharacterized membrane protein YgdD (TMEM256/DUF423 family)|uniref:DUF423 domain-containing protein n=3 Tax=Paenibacillus TaxID=44249 RepID=A0AAJ3J0I6_PAEPO|nr:MULTISPECIES: DUF423 domain-containing protein [Paenibacillus]ADM70134.1 membrane protein [Paenibacillus polymyxa E681]AHC19968.1 membrane protein [Paenibacillus polymyxa CR1]ALA42222.1 membrane protein [Paenibacillus peoriae]APB76054.1 DUF423 domain-containing protein [Paenibacillus polymyxa]APQ59412.1 membrane protein [Paenibacillus polymyxa]
MKILLLLGCIVMFLAVALGAFGAHALKKRLSVDMMSIFQTGIQYQIAHGLGLLLLGVLADSLVHSSLIVTAGWVMLVGILLFSGSLYALSISGVKKLGAITPIGGLAFLASWVIVIVAVVQG